MQIQGLDVLLIMPEFSNPPKLTGNQKTSDVDLSEATRISAFVGDHPLHSLAHHFKFTTRASAALLEDFVDGLRGKWHAFWMPSWHAELNPVADLLNGQTQLSITPVNYAAVFNPADTNLAKLGHYVWLLHYDGTLLVRGVSSVSGTSPEVLTLDSAVTRDFTVGNFVVGFLYCVRLLADDFTLTYNGLSKIDCDLAVMEVSRFDQGTDGSTVPTASTPLVAGFTSDVSQGDPPLSVNFTDTSTGSPAAWDWNFGDGSAHSSTQNPTHSFSNAGTYIVTLKVTASDGSTSSISSTIVVNDISIPSVPPPLAAAFTYTPSSGNVALTVTFTDTSTGTPVAWLWDFGDLTPQSSDQNPVHSYPNPGVYTVTLIVFDDTGASNAVTHLVTAIMPTMSCPFGLCATLCATLSAYSIGDAAPILKTDLNTCLGFTVNPGTIFTLPTGGTFSVDVFDVTYHEVTRTG